MKHSIKTNFARLRPKRFDTKNRIGTDIKNEMKGRLNELVNIAPWTTWIFSCEREAEDEYDYLINYYGDKK